jgi:hypothetical protein
MGHPRRFPTQAKGGLEWATRQQRSPRGQEKAGSGAEIGNTTFPKNRVTRTGAYSAPKLTMLAGSYSC